MMKNRRTYVFIFFNLAWLFLALNSFSQADTLRYGGLRFSINLGKGIDYLKKPAQPGFEFMIDAEIRDGWLVVAEGGYSETLLEKYNYNFSAHGYYFRLGVDRNFLKRAYNENEMIYVGARISGSTFSQQADNILIENPYWGNMITHTEPEQVNAFWLEFTAGIRAELFPNFFIGWGLQSRMFLNYASPQLTPWYVPGFGTTQKGSLQKKTTIGIQYIIAYRIPYKLKR